MGKINNIWSYLARHKYLITIVLGLLLIGVVGENSLLHYMQLQVRLSEVREELEECQQQYERDSIRLRALQSNHKGVVRIAREKYFMKHPDEDVFVLSNEEHKQSTENTDERVE